MKEKINLGNGKIVGIEKPDICSYCNIGINPIIVSHFLDDYYDDKRLYVGLKCPVCRNTFIVEYNLGYYEKVISNHFFHRSKILGGNLKNKNFSKEINNLSPDFVKIYNDAYKAEQNNCEAIIGLGFRLSFEFLIKDYCSFFNPIYKEKIITMNLSDCINTYLDPDIKDIAKRGNWLGNDFAHYFSKHPDMDSNDMKKIIDICVAKIEFKLKEKEYIDSINPK